MSKKNCNTIELKKPGNFGILSSLDGDSMAMSREEAEKKREQLKRRYNLILTTQEGELFDDLLLEYQCKSASDFIKKIIKKEFKISK